MPESTIPVNTIDEYILQFSPHVQALLKKLKNVIKEAAPVGFYPGPSGIEAFKSELSNYKGAKGSVQFPLDKPLPYELIGKIVTFRVAENTAKRSEKG
ncbi:iron chaperone [Anaerospora hongkongensis]|uniref:iron chaperone n=1 Tax=Anaerospora hongkongensis TaxID=244830 RepID=UPI00289D32D1|nr:hypothetical protein [Anaerospora hongkongensis]